MISDLFCFFVCFSNANKINKHVNTKTFVIATFFWAKCALSDRSAGVPIFLTMNVYAVVFS